MPLTFPTTTQKKPSAFTALPNQIKRPAFGSLYGFDAQGGGGAATSVTQQNNLINWWKMDEGAGSTAADSGSAAASASNFTLVNDSTWGDGSGKRPNGTDDYDLGSVALDGTGDYVTTSTFNLGLTDAFTISVWVKSNYTSATIYYFGYRILIHYAVTVADPGFIFGWHPSNDNTHMSIKVDSTVDTEYATNTAISDVRLWANYIFTWASGVGMKQYANGTLIDTSPDALTGNMANMTGDVLQMGIRQDYAPQTLFGELSDVRIYDMEFDSDDVDALYNSGDGDRG
tara:strand:+ start:5593 stop:6450 length:858 start_codon:yes stop_codon:yes gene_type:complete